MFKEPKAMREIHKIQEKIYEEEKKLTPAQRIHRVKEAARKLMEEYGLKSKTHVAIGAR
jgi:hypothetical protein